MTQAGKEPFSSEDKQSGGLSLLLRLFWIVIGNFVLFLMIFGIYGGNKGFSLKDVIYGATVFLLILVRYIDIKFLGGLTAQGTPASMKHWHRYVAGLIVCAGLFWGLAHVANYFFS